MEGIEEDALDQPRSFGDIPERGASVYCQLDNLHASAFLTFIRGNTSIPYTSPHHVSTPISTRESLTIDRGLLPEGPKIVSPEIERISLHNPIPIHLRLYGLPCLCKLLFRLLVVGS
jgi:hypothetical protein